MKRLLLFNMFVSVFFYASAQTNSFPEFGKAGIGTTSPETLLSVYGSVSGGGYGVFPEIEINNPNVTDVSYSALVFRSGTASSVIGVSGAVGELFSSSNDNAGQYLWLRSLGSSYPLYIGFNQSDLSIKSGNVGIGTISPTQKLTVSGTVSATNVQSSYLAKSLSDNFTYDSQSFGNYALGWQTDSWTPQGFTAWLSGFGGIKLFTQRLPRLSIDYSGHVLIGKTSQTNTDYILDVAGDVRADKVVVNTTGADFVFDSSYQLQPLKKLESYIQQNHHLPQIPSADSMQKIGLDIGENQTKLLQKIEELTLYIIEQKQEISKQSQQTDEQSELINKLGQIVKKQQAQINLLIKQVGK